MFAFSIIVSPLILILITYLIYESLIFIYNKLKIRLILQKYISSIIFFSFFISILNVEKIQMFHTDMIKEVKNKRCNNINLYSFSRKLDNLLSDNKYVIFNLPQFSHIAIMVMSKQTAYDYLPDRNQIQQLKAAKKHIAVIQTDSLPEFISSDVSILKINSKYCFVENNKKNNIPVKK
jgi:hypothetical protein